MLMLIACLERMISIKELTQPAVKLLCLLISKIDGPVYLAPAAGNGPGRRHLVRVNDENPGMRF